MYNRSKTLTRYGRPAAASVASALVPASTGGINAVDSLLAMPPQDALYTYNLMPVEYGLRLRQGYREWATGCVEEPQRGTGEVRTIIPFESNVLDEANNRLFAVTDEGIWDVTQLNTTNPSQEVVFAQVSDPAGRGVHCEFTGDAAGSGTRGHYLFYADGLNGIWQYEEATDTWSQPASGVGDTDWWYLPPGGTDPNDRIPFPVDNVAFVMVHKQRIWVILEDEDDAWYLPVASISGQLTRFNFGSKMPHGGTLLGLWNWTLDGGDGVDDYMVAIGRGGDVMLYRGEDPEITPDGSNVGPWASAGTWYIGEMPISRRAVEEWGAEMFILSTYGIASLRDLLQGTPVDVVGAPSVSKKINRYLRSDVVAGKLEHQWQMVINPSDGSMMIITPTPTTTDFIQYSMNLNTGAWGLWEGVPITCGDNWAGSFYMGASVASYGAGVVLIYDGSLDGATLAGDEGDPIPFRVLTSFQSYGEHAALKRVGITRTVGVVSGQSNLSVRTVYDYQIDFTAQAPTQAPSELPSVWDGSVWGQATWDFPLSGESFPAGTLGAGRTVAIYLNGNATNRINIVGWDIMLQGGGYM